MRSRLFVLAAAILMSGCSQAPPVDGPPEAGPVEPTPTVADFAIDERVFPEGSGSCGPVPIACLGFPGDDQWVFATPFNGTLTALHAEVTKSPAYPEVVTWSLGCRGEEAQEACRLPLAEGEGPLPITIDVAGVRLPPLTDVTVRLSVPPIAAPGADLASEVARSFLAAPRFVGTATIELAPGNLTLAPVPFAFEGSSGPCPEDLQQCPGLPGGTEFTKGLGTVRELHFTMTWSSTSEADRVLGLWVSSVQCRSTCKPQHLVSGPSPLVAEFPTTHWEGLRLFVTHPGPNEDGVPYSMDNPVGTRTPVHVEGVAWVEAPASGATPN